MSTADSQVLHVSGLPFARSVPGTGPVIALALHAGALIRPEVTEFIGASSEELRREEDLFTAQFSPPGVPLIEVLRSRFEVDLNRPRERAIYQGPEDAWGVDVYSQEMPDVMRERSLEAYDAFYDMVYDLLAGIARDQDRFVVLDLHSYNHRRDGADAPPVADEDNPELNLGTGWLDRDRWAPVVEAFTETMHRAGLDCRENVKFRGGHFAHWVARSFPESGAVLAIEFKKTYMDEWTGAVDHEAVAAIRTALAAGVIAIADSLDDVT